MFSIHEEIVDSLLLPWSWNR